MKKYKNLISGPILFVTMVSASGFLIFVIITIRETFSADHKHKAVISVQNLKEFQKLSCPSSIINVSRNKDWDPKIKDNVRRILWWNTIFNLGNQGGKTGFFRVGTGQALRELEKKCKYKCKFTDDRTVINKSHAVMFHAWHRDLKAETVMLNDTEMLIPLDAPLYRDINQVYVYFTSESSVRMRTDMRAYRYFFNWTMSYRLDSDFPITYGRFYRKTPKEIQDYGTGPDWTPQANRTNLAAWIVSNCNGTHGERRRIADELKKHIRIDIYGKCGTKKCGKDCFEQLGKEYKFYLSFENSLCRDYVTEKFFNALEANMVPLVYGRANYGQQFAPGSFINVDSFASAKALADYLVYLDRNPVEYIKYFRWRKYYREEQSIEMTKLFCGVCERLHKEYGVTKTNLDIVDWMFKNHSDSLMCNHPIDEF